MKIPKLFLIIKVPISRLHLSRILYSIKYYWLLFPLSNILRWLPWPFIVQVLYISALYNFFCVQVFPMSSFFKLILWVFIFLLICYSLPSLSWQSIHLHSFDAKNYNCISEFSVLSALQLKSPLILNCS